MQAVTINTNAWTDAGHSVNQLYDILFMMGRDDVSVGVGGEGSILEDGTILPNVGGYHPIIEQVSPLSFHESMLKIKYLSRIISNLDLSIIGSFTRAMVQLDIADIDRPYQ